MARSVYSSHQSIFHLSSPVSFALLNLQEDACPPDGHGNSQATCYMTAPQSQEQGKGSLGGRRRRRRLSDGTASPHLSLLLPAAERWSASARRRGKKSKPSHGVIRTPPSTAHPPPRSGLKRFLRARFSVIPKPI